MRFRVCASPISIRFVNDHCFIAVLTLCACTPPLDQVLQLWDFLLAFGVHLNVLCVIAQLLLMRDEVMVSARFISNFVVAHSMLILILVPCAYCEHSHPSRQFQS